MLGFGTAYDIAKSGATITDSFNIPELNGQVIDNIGLLQRGQNAYSLDGDGIVTLSYNDSDYNAKTPLKLLPSGSDSNNGIGVDEAEFYISAEKTAIAYGGINNEPLYEITSEDMGKTWTQSGNPDSSDARVVTRAGFPDNKTGFLCFRFETSQLNISTT